MMIKSFGPRFRAPWVCAMIAFLGQFVAVDRSSMADLVLNNSTIRATFVGDTDNALISTFTATSATGALNTNFNYNGLAGGLADAFSITNPWVAGFGFGVGTGVTRTDPTDIITGATTLTIDFTGTWTVVNSSFGPTLFNFAYFPIQAILEAGDQAVFRLNATYPDGTIINPQLNFNVPGTTIQQISYLQPSTIPSFRVGDTFSLSGSIFFSFRGNSTGSTTIAPPGGGVVPEPSSVILMGIGGLTLLGFARGRLRVESAAS